MKDQALDVSNLRQAALDHRSLVWWGNALLLVIETVMFALLVAAYLYLRMNTSEWPPPLVHAGNTIHHPVPPLGAPLTTLFVLLVSLIPTISADRSALRMQESGVKSAMGFLVLFGVAAIVLRWRELPALQFHWDDNAYASVIWTIVCLHLLHLIVATAENLAMCLWVSSHPLDPKHARDVRASCVYWYWVVGTWIFLFVLIYLGPRFS